MNESTQNSHRPLTPADLERLADPRSAEVDKLHAEVTRLWQQIAMLNDRLTPTRFEVALEWARWLGFIVLVVYGSVAAIEALL